MSSEKIPFNHKLVDVGMPAKGGRVDDYWRKKILRDIFGTRRASSETKNANFKFWDAEWLVKTFKLKGIEFGNWLSQQDRYVYMAGAAYAMKDFCDIHGVKYELFGLNHKFTLAFGARGQSRALAHFEPSTYAINLTKHREREYKDSGAGSLGHEYGHALDFYFGQHSNFE